MSSRVVRNAVTIIRFATSVALFATFAFALFVGAKGPGGVEQQVGWPHDRTGPATLDRLDFPHCVTPDQFEGIPATSVIVTDRGVAREVPFASAWNRNNDATTINNVRVLGSCA